MAYFCLPLLFVVLVAFLGPFFVLNFVKVVVLLVLKIKKIKFLEKVDEDLNVFTPFENAKNVLSLEKDNPKVHICCFDGMRTLGVISIIIGHLISYCK